MKTIALWLEFRFNLFLVPFEDVGNTKLSLCHLRTSFSEIPPVVTPPISWIIFICGTNITHGDDHPNVSRSRSTICSHDDVIKWKHFPRYWPFVRGSHRWIPLTEASDAELWTNGWVNNRCAGDLRHHCAHYDVIVMSTQRPAHRHLL